MYTPTVCYFIALAGLRDFYLHQNKFKSAAIVAAFGWLIICHVHHGAGFISHIVNDPDFVLIEYIITHIRFRTRLSELYSIATVSEFRMDTPDLVYSEISKIRNGSDEIGTLFNYRKLWSRLNDVKIVRVLDKHFTKISPRHDDVFAMDGIYDLTSARPEPNTFTGQPEDALHGVAFVIYSIMFELDSGLIDFGVGEKMKHDIVIYIWSELEKTCSDILPYQGRIRACLCELLNNIE